MLTISQSKVDSISKSLVNLDSTSKEVRKAFNVALGRATLRAKNRIAKEIAQELKLPLKAVRRRLLLFKAQKNKDIKIWAGIDSIPFGYFGKGRQVGDSVVVKNFKVDDAYISKSGKIKDAYTNEVKRLPVDIDISKILEQRLPYYVESEFEKQFEQILRYKFKK